MDNQIMNRENELEIVKTAYFLEKNIDELQIANNQLSNNRPQQPQLLEPEYVQPQYPNIDTTNIEYSKKWKTIALLGLPILFLGNILMVKFIDSLFMLGFLMICGGIGLSIYALVKNGKEKKQAEEQYINKIKSSTDYINMCKSIDEEQKLNYQHLVETARLDYNNQLEKYNNEYPKWQEQYNLLNEALNDTRQSLQELYSTNVIPGKYRNLTAVTFLASFLGTSNYDLQFAIERYDKEIDQIIARQQCEELAAQRDLLTQINQNQQYSNWLNEQMIYISEQGNSTLHSIKNWQKADVALNAVRLLKNK